MNEYQDVDNELRIRNLNLRASGDDDDVNQCGYPDAPLDHTLYPHLIDAILRAASPAALLALRPTSRAFRDRADSIFASHVVIANSTSGHHGPPHPPSIPTTPSSSFLHVSPHSAPRFRPPLDLRRTRIVDLVGPVSARTIAYRCTGGKTGHELYLEYLASRLVNLELVRLRLDRDGRATSSCPLRTNSLIAFTQFSEPESGYSSTAPIGSIPQSVSHLVLNISYEPSAWYLPRATVSMADDLSQRDNLSSVVILLSPRPSGPGCTRAFGESVSPQWMGMMCSIVNLMASTLPRVKYTLVGVDRLEPDWVGEEPEWHNSPSPPTTHGFFHYRKGVKHLVEDAIATELRRRNVWWTEDEVEDALRTVTFLTRAAYERSVTPRRFELETIE